MKSREYRGVVVALSGGSDSTALLHLLWRLSKQHNFFSLAVFHCDYGLRGAASAQDRAFAESLSKMLNTEFFCRTVSAEERQARQGESLQAWARRLRQDEFQILKAQGWLVALGHHRDDLAENVLLRLARGASPEHLLGMRSWTPPYWRPLLHQPKTALLAFLAANKLSFREDQSNQTDAYSRNQIRHNVLPVLEKLYPGAGARMVACAEEARDLAEFATSHDALGLADRPSNHGAAPTKGLARHRIAKQVAEVAPGHQQLSRRLLDTAMSGRTTTLAGGQTVKWANGALCSPAQPPRIKAKRSHQHDRGLAGPSRGSLLEPSSYSSFIGLGGHFTLMGRGAKIDSPIVPMYIRLSPVCSNRCLRFSGQEQPVKIKNLMQNLSIPVELRASWALVECDDKAAYLFDGQTLHRPNPHEMQSGCSQVGLKMRYLNEGGAMRRPSLFSPQVRRADQGAFDG